MAVFTQNLLWYLVLLIQTCSICSEYVYPLGIVPNSDPLKIYVLYQKTLQHLELWIWDPQSHVAVKGLLSTYTPAGLQIFPDGTGFSFIDNGRLRIKKFDTGSITTIPMNQPVYDFSLLYWLDTQHFYMSAKQCDQYAIFLGDTTGNINIVHSQDDTDCLFPQKIDDDYYWIERKHLDQLEQFYSIVKNKNTIYVHGKEPIIFLHMHNAQCGFFVGYDLPVGMHHAILSCHYYMIVCDDNNQWTTNKLFDFSLPTHLFFANHPETCLHETLLPLVPRHYGDIIYFCDTETHTTMRRRALSANVYGFHMGEQNIIRYTHASSGEYLFAPLVIDNILYVGGTIQENDAAPKIWMNDNGETCLSLVNR